MKSGAEHFFAVDQTEDMEKAVKDATGQWGVAAALVLTGMFCQMTVKDAPEDSQPCTSESKSIR